MVGTGGEEHGFVERKETEGDLEDGLRNAVEVGRDVAIEQQHAETAESGPVIVVYI